MPQPITRTWELMFSIPHWILNFFHIEGRLIIRIEITISAHNREDFYNIVYCEMPFAQYSCNPLPHHVEELRIVLGYLWPNHFYQVEEEEIICTLSRVSIATGVTASGHSTWFNTPSPPSSPQPIIPPNHFISGLHIPSTSLSQSRATKFNRPPFPADLTVKKVFA